MIIDNFTIDGTTVIPNPEESATEELNKLQIEDTVYSVGSGGGGGTGQYTIEILAGDMTATYSTALPSYALPTTKTSLENGKKWTDYDEICIVSIVQQSANQSSPRLYNYKKIPVWALSHCEGDYGVTVSTTETWGGSASQGTRVILFPDNSYRNDWYNYASPIAILGIKYNGGN